MRKKYILSLAVFIFCAHGIIRAGEGNTDLDFYVPTILIKTNKVFSIVSPPKRKILKTPVLISPGERTGIDTINTTTPYFRWRKVPFAESHLLRIYKKVSTDRYELIFNSAYYVVIVDTAFQIIPGILDNNETYLWYVMALNKHGISEWSEPFKFTIREKAKKQIRKITEPQKSQFEFEQPLADFEHNEPEEVFLTFKYGNVVNIPLIAYKRDEKLYLPVKTLFSALKIYFEDDTDSKTMTGFYINPSNKYSLDFGKNDFNVNLKKINLNKNEYYSNRFSDEYYLTPGAFEKIFGMEFTVNYRKLILRLNSKILLPVYERKLSRLNFDIFKNREKKFEFGQFFPNQRDLLTFGFLDYNLSSSINKNASTNSGYYFGISSALLGGEANFSVNGTAIDSKVINDRIDWNWRYGMFNDYLTQIVLGDFFTQGLSSYNLRGVSLTNEPLEARRHFTNIELRNVTHPGWKVELYKNNIPVDFVTADEKGRYQFNVPMNYGMTYIKLRYLGTKGEIYEEEKLFHIPYELIPPEEFNYHVNFGETPFTKIKIAQADAEYGISKQLTNKIGFDYVKSRNYNRGVFYNSLTVKISTEYLANIIAAPNAFYKFNVSGIFPSLSSFDVSFTFYNNNPFFNPTNIENEFNANFYYPVNYSGLPVNIFGFGQFLNFKDNGKRKNLRFGINSTFQRFSPTLTYEYFNTENTFSDFTHSVLSFGFFYSLPQLPGIFKSLYGNVLSAKFTHNLTSGKIENIFFAISSNLFRNTRLQIVHSENLLSNISTTSLQLIVDFSFTRSTTTITNSQFTQNLSGSVGYDINYNNFHAYNRFQKGRSAAVINCFVDSNGNSKYDPGERRVKGLKISLNNLSKIDYNEGGMILVSELIPYSVYYGKIIDSKVQNPLLVPKFKEFSFVADPNKYKRIDIPFYFAGEISGYVRREAKEETITLSGMPVVIENLSNHKIYRINTFSDGSFYYFGLLPGKYKIYLDKKIVSKIGKTTEPEFYNIEIKSVESGEYFDNMEFLIK